MTGLGVIALFLVLVVGLAVLRVRKGRRARREFLEAEAAERGSDVFTAEEPNAGALGLAVVAATLAVVSVFLPALETSSLSTIAENTLIQSGGGWLILGCAVGILGAVYRLHSMKEPTWAVSLLGTVILGMAIYNGTGERTQLESSAGSFVGESITVSGSPAVGIYAAGAAGLLAIFAGFILAGNHVGSFEGAERKTKVCPDCAETVLEAARKCKHCGHQFGAAPATG